MNWQSIDFHGVIELNEKIVEQLEQFLQEKENKLAHEILCLIPIASAEKPDLLLPPVLNFIKLSEVVESFVKKTRSVVVEEINTQKSGNEAGQLVKDVNSVLWNFTEVLESCAIELFQRVQQLSIDCWSVSLLNVVSSIKAILIHYTDDLIWVIRRLEKPLNQYYQKFHPGEQKSWDSFFSLRGDILDRKLLENLEKTEKFLNEQYADFQKCHDEYMCLSAQSRDFVGQVEGFPILNTLERVDQNVYLSIFRLLKLIELNPNSKGIVANNIKKGLNRLTSLDNVLRVLNIYFLEIKKTLFKSSLEWKSMDRENENFEKNLERILLRLGECQDELRVLIHTMGGYRTFILTNDPNPYVRSRWGFSEWIVGSEPIKAKKIADKIYAANELDECFTQFNQSIGECRAEQQKIEAQARSKIENILHEMGQPLISRSMMKELAERLLNDLRMNNEIGSPDISIIGYVEDIFSKVMRLDWKYHVLHEIPLFHKLYHLHQGVMEHFDDPSHAFRLERFRQFLDQIKKWVEKENMYSHIHEIDQDMNDMKTYLQDFLAAVQRSEKNKSSDLFLNHALHKFRQQLLEYRYLFGQFFSIIMSKSLDGIQLRNQFLFVDQYFESVENYLNQMKMSKKQMN